MHVAVLGAGVVGVTTAYYLTEAGHDVTIIDRNDEVAGGCSHANGGQLSYSYVDAMANPAFLFRTLGLIAGIDNAIRIRPPLTLDFFRWGLKFIGECRQRNAATNTLANIELALRSKALLEELRHQLAGDFSFRTAGKLVLLRKDSELKNARRISGLKAEMGCPADVVTMGEAADIEPAVAHMAGHYAGAVYSSGDDVGDARAFTRALAQLLQSRTNCHFELETTIDGLIAENNVLKGIATDHGLIDVDAVIVSLGAWSPSILKPLGIDIPVYPARGYSVTLEPGEHPAAVSVTDFGKRFVISRLGEQVRIAGFADFVGFRRSSDDKRISDLLKVARTNAPDAANYESSPNHAWGGFRPLTPNGRPIIGATPVHGVYLNTGHGSLGWTLACASAERAAQLVNGARTAALAA